MGPARCLGCTRFECQLTGYSKFTRFFSPFPLVLPLPDGGDDGAPLEHRQQAVVLCRLRPAANCTEGFLRPRIAASSARPARHRRTERSTLLQRLYARHIPRALQPHHRPHTPGALPPVFLPRNERKGRALAAKRSSSKKPKPTPPAAARKAPSTNERPRPVAQAPPALFFATPAASGLVFE